jgi:hypothetical protein
MRKPLFYAGIGLLVLFELANVYFIMPLPYSQRVRSIDVAFFLYRFRWAFRVILGAMIARNVGAVWAHGRVAQRVAARAALTLAAAVVYVTNFTMAADQIFLPPTSLVMSGAEQNAVEPQRLVVGVEINGDARAYPVQFIGYHHQMRDSVGGKPVLITFCTVCRTGRVYSPIVDGRAERFRLVGMDHFNAMLEDKTTGSWWRQANGEAIAGPRTGAHLGEIQSEQMTLRQWLTLHPQSLVMQADTALRNQYASDFDYETGKSRKRLTGTDTASWHDKSWVVGVTVNRTSRAYDWNRLRRERVVNDELGGVPIVVLLAEDDAGYFAFARPDTATRFALRGDSLIAPGHAYDLTGRGASGELSAIFASQEFWHSWRTFHPGTTTY